MKHTKITAAIAAVTIAILGLTGCTDSAKTPAPNEESSQYTTNNQPASDLGPDGRPIRAGEELRDHEATVAYVIDGDTVVVKTTDGSKETVRLLGIDAPEIKHKDQPDSKDECGGQEAKAALEEFLPQGTPVRVQVENDLSEKEMAKIDALYIQPVANPDRIDKYGRTLAYLVKTSPEILYERTDVMPMEDIVKNEASTHMASIGMVTTLTPEDIGFTKEGYIEQLTSGIKFGAVAPEGFRAIQVQYNIARRDNIGLNATCPDLHAAKDKRDEQYREVNMMIKNGEIVEKVPNIIKSFQ